MKTSSDEDLQRSLYYFTQCKNLAKFHAVSAAPAMYQHGVIQENLNSSQTGSDIDDQLRPINKWVILIDQNELFALNHHPEKKVNIQTKALGDKVHKGDLCFYVAKSLHQNSENGIKKDRWAVVAIYEAMTDPIWDPLCRYVNTLQLLEKISDRVVIDISFVDSQSETNSKKLFELDDSGLDLITEAVQRRNQGVDHQSERRKINLENKKLS
jgi:hypothetical protein